ncbi:MAG: type II secretion system protein [Phycisphaerales bacterium]|nr:type II secretion system protein [Phycisphaerales bacterium]
MRRAFTLIELLMVIAIISLLMGILLPAIGMARRHAQSVVGNANLRSLTQMMTMYTGDNHDAFLNPFHTGCTGESPCCRPDCTDAYIPVPLDDDGNAQGVCRTWDFGVPSDDDYATEYFSYYWYSYLKALEDAPPFAEEQVSPADAHIRALSQNYRDSAAGAGEPSLWPSSFLYSPTFWISPERYDPGCGRQPNDLNRYGKTQLQASVAFPSSKVLLFERMDLEQRERVRIEPSDAIREGSPPAWNNLRATTAVSVVDGSVEEVSMLELYSKTEDPNWDTAPVGVGRTLDEPPIVLNKSASPGVLGGGNRTDGEYPLFFWATQWGVQGRDLPR